MEKRPNLRFPSAHKALGLSAYRLSWKLLILLVFLSNYASPQEPEQRQLSFLMMSEKAPISEIRFTGITLHPKKMADSESSRSAETSLNITVSGWFTNANRTLYIAGKEVHPKKDGSFSEDLTAELENNEMSVPLYARGRNKVGDQEAVLKISILTDTITELDTHAVPESTFTLADEKPAPSPEPVNVVQVAEENQEVQKVAEAPPAMTAADDNGLEKLEQKAWADKAREEEAARALASNATALSETTNQDKLYYLGRATLVSPIDQITFAPLLGVSIWGPLSSETQWELRVSAAAGETNTGLTTYVVEPGALARFRLDQSLAFSLGSLYQYWGGGTKESYIVPTGELTYSFEKPILACRHVSLGYTYLVASDLHTQQARLSFLFNF